jgi:hypothetical protein
MKTKSLSDVKSRAPCSIAVAVIRQSTAEAAMPLLRHVFAIRAVSIWVFCVARITGKPARASSSLSNWACSRTPERISWRTIPGRAISSSASIKSRKSVLRRGLSTSIHACEMQGTRLRYRQESPPLSLLFVVDVRVEIEAAKCFEGAKTLTSQDVFQKGLIYCRPLGMVASEAFSFIK